MGSGCWSEIRIKPPKENNLGVAHALFDHKGDDDKKDNQITSITDFICTNDVDIESCLSHTSDDSQLLLVVFLSLVFSVEVFFTPPALVIPVKVECTFLFLNTIRKSKTKNFLEGR